ncbi:MAG: chromosomal replication initiator protein DnaA [Candidatus Paceibacterota bacterium]|nr:MAG: chromosomal replication initiator protein DnaA [Candidatus Paceibacterota bacterium]
MDDNKKLWENALAEIEMSISPANFNTWFKDTLISKKDGGVVFLSVPNAFVKEWLSSKHHNFILKTIRKLSDDVRALEYNISPTDPKKRGVESPSKPVSVRGIANKELPLGEFHINREDNLNPKYTFDSFVVGPFNELAFAASQAIVKQPGLVYNPLFIYGNTGVGKTHLIQAIGNQIKTSYPEKRVHYATSEKFAMDYINSVQTNKVNNFKEKYRKYDVLIMDDIQFLSSKEKTQEELFHLFNNIHDSNKQIIFSSDKHPNFIPDMEDRLKSRFSAGMIVDIPIPDHESRAAILKTKSKSLNIELSQEIIDFIASTITSNVRELEGALNTISCQHQIKNRELTLNDVKNLLRHSSKPKKTLSVKEVIKIVSDFYNMEEGTIYEKTRKKEVIKPRQIIMYLLREDFGISYPSIGEKLGGRDHTTVIHSCEKIRGEIKNDSVLFKEIEQLRSIIS